MSQEAEAVREAVAVFRSAADLQAAIDELLSSGFHRSALSLLAAEDAVKEKLDGRFANTRALEDYPAAPRSAYVSPEAIGDAQGGVVGGLVYAGAPAAAGAVIFSGGTVAIALFAATLAGGGGALVGSLLAKWLGDHHGRYLEAQINNGGLLLWVRTWDAEAEDRALDILIRHSSLDAHPHTMS